MTWSIIARDRESGAFGVAVASKFFAVGAICPHGDGGVGALSTQALPNPLWGTRGLRLLREGMAAEHVVAHLVAPDPGADQRQFHVHDRGGRIAAHTGKQCIDWAGHLVRDGVSVAGNMLAGPSVIEATADAYEASRERSFARRLIAAMKAGEAEGGDKRGRQSAAILIHDAEEYPLVDIRVDDHQDPLAELGRLLDVWKGRPQFYRRALPSRARPSGIVGREAIERFIAEQLEAESRTGPGAGVA